MAGAKPKKSSSNNYVLPSVVLIYSHSVISSPVGNTIAE